MLRAVAGVVFLVFLSAVVFGQSNDSSAPAAKSDAPASAAFGIADVHVAAHRNFPYMDGGNLKGDRYMIHDATMVDLISTAYKVDEDNVLGGPAWLETDRFDVIAKAPPATSEETLRRMLQALLADRFQLVSHQDSKPLLGYVLSVPKGGKSKLRESDGSGSGCNAGDQDQQQGGVRLIVVNCKNMTADEIASALHDMAGGYLTSPVVNTTGLRGSWDFDLQWTPRGLLAQAGDQGISIFDAVDKQLGLKLDLEKTPQPVIVVDSVNETPTPNPPEVAKVLPPSPPAEFEVAVIKPSAPDAQLRFRIDGAQLSIQDASLKLLIDAAWELNFSDDNIQNAPKWLDSDHWDIIGKAAMDAQQGANGKPVPPQFEQEDLEHMLQSLLMDRFGLKVHMEDRPVSAYTLVADKPKLTKGDPAQRTRCKEGPGPDGKDPRIANPTLNRLISCQNMNMAEFADMLQSLAPGYIHTPVKDGTGLEGGYDFTLSFSGVGQLPGAAGGGGAAPPSANGTPADPTGAVSLIDAIDKGLGVKLVKETRPAAVLVIDHVNEQPTDN
jgi:uncharacterized protein (TIGR03435 family)